MTDVAQAQRTHANGNPPSDGLSRLENVIGRKAHQFELRACPKRKMHSLHMPCLKFKSEAVDVLSAIEIATHN